MSLIIPVSQEQIRHVAMAVMTGIHEVFLPEDTDNNNPILEKKLKQGEGIYSTRKTLLGFDFNGEEKLCGSKKQNKKITDNPKRMDKDRETRDNGNTIHQVQIHNCKNQTRIYVYSCRGRFALPMQ